MAGGPGHVSKGIEAWAVETLVGETSEQAGQATRLNIDKVPYLRQTGRQADRGRDRRK